MKNNFKKNLVVYIVSSRQLIEVPINTFSYLLVLNANPKHAFFYFTSNFCMVVRRGVVRVT